MKKISKIKIIGLMILTSVFTVFIMYLIASPRQVDAYSGLVSRLMGKILLRVQHRGEAWYVNPDNGQRYFLGRPQDAFNLMRSLGLGISNDDLFDIPLASGNYDEITFNSTYGFSYGYPSTYYHLPNYSPFNDVNKYQSFSNYAEPLLQNDSISISISMNDNVDNLTLQEYAEEFPSHSTCVKTISNPFIINGNQAIQIINDCTNMTDSEPSYTVWNYIAKNNKIYSIYSLTMNINTFNNRQAEYYTFINSFQIN